MKFKIIAMMMLMCFVTGCTNDGVENNQQQTNPPIENSEEINKEEDKVDQDKEEDEKEEEKPEQENEKEEITPPPAQEEEKEEVKPQEEDKEEVTPQEETSYVELNINYKDSDYNINTLETIKIEEDKDMTQKLQAVINEVSSKLFDNKVIELVKIENNIAYINLADVEGNEWYNSFQGSTGGIITSYNILENLLQRNYNGEWIDGVYITYNGEAEEMDHTGDMFFGTIIKR